MFIKIKNWWNWEKKYRSNLKFSIFNISQYEKDLKQCLKKFRQENPIRYTIFYFQQWIRIFLEKINFKKDYKIYKFNE